MLDKRNLIFYQMKSLK